MRNEEVRNVARGKVMECLICNQQDLVVDYEFYRKPTEGSQNRGNMGPTVGSA